MEFRKNRLANREDSRETSDFSVKNSMKICPGAMSSAKELKLFCSIRAKPLW